LRTFSSCSGFGGGAVNVKADIFNSRGVGCL
jgi:hypothetical protein